MYEEYLKHDLIKVSESQMTRKHVGETVQTVIIYSKSKEGTTVITLSTSLVQLFPVVALTVKSSWCINLSHRFLCDNYFIS